MSFFKSLAHAFGFGNEDDGVEKNVVNMISDDSQSCSCEREVPRNERDKDSQCGTGDGFPTELFDSVLEIFNNTQPDFIRECIDKDAQRRYLYGVLGNSFRASVDKCRDHIEKEVAVKMSAERDKLVDEIARLKNKLESIEGHEIQLNEAKLSANRQKRALSDKINTLEQQVLSLEAEKEQYKLEINSLLNKIETAEVPEVNENEGRQSEIAELKTKLNQSNFIAEQLRQEVDKLKKEMLETSELYKSRMAMSDKMLSDIRNTNRNSAKELEDVKSENALLQEKYNKAIADVERLGSELQDARSTLETADEVMAKMAQFDSVLKKRDERLQKMKEENDDLLSKVSSLEADNKRLAADLETNVLERASSENELRQTIEELSKKPAASTLEKPRRKRKSTPKISAIDDTIDSTEWLVSTPPENTPKVTPAVSDSDFGYQEPPKKSHPANDAQMSLF